MKATEQYFPVVLVLYKVFVDEILHCDYSVNDVQQFFPVVLYKVVLT